MAIRQHITGNWTTYYGQLGDKLRQLGNIWQFGDILRQWDEILRQLVETLRQWDEILRQLGDILRLLGDLLLQLSIGRHIKAI